MELVLTFYSVLCTGDNFYINGFDASPYDFGDKYDRSPRAFGERGCGDMRFTRKPSTPEILARYKITEAEYSEICDKLEVGLSFGRCRWCG